MLLLLLKRIRPVNLLIIALTQALLRYTLIIPFLKISGLATSVSDAWFVMLVISTLLIAAGGYLVNDADDAVIDSINQRQVTETPDTKDLKFYGTVLLLTGVLTGFCISFFGNMKTVWGIQLFAALILFNYSSLIKKIPLLASLSVSLLTAFTLLIVFTSDSSANQAPEIRKLVLGYSLFAFILSMARETIKDIQDEKGDREAGRKTLPIISGILFSKIFSVLMLLAVVFLLAFIQIIRQQWTNIPAFVYVLLTIQLPIIFISVKIFRDKSPSQYALTSHLCRWVMVAGVLTMPLFYIIL